MTLPKFTFYTVTAASKGNHGIDNILDIT